MSIKPVPLALLCIGMLAGASAFRFALADNPRIESAVVEVDEAQSRYLFVPTQMEFAPSHSL